MVVPKTLSYALWGALNLDAARSANVMSDLAMEFRAVAAGNRTISG